LRTERAAPRVTAAAVVFYLGAFEDEQEHAKYCGVLVHDRGRTKASIPMVPAAAVCSNPISRSYYLAYRAARVFGATMPSSSASSVLAGS